MKKILVCVMMAWWSMIGPSSSSADEATVAVAANFLRTIESLTDQFEQTTGHRIVISSGSSGKLYAQIKNGAPFDALFSADGRRPKLLVQGGFAVPGSRFTYAIGRLTLWSPDPERIGPNAKTVLARGDYNYLAIANPKTAPYGLAAKQTLEKLGLWTPLQKKLVRGENIGQAFQFVASKNAQVGLVALSQVLAPKYKGLGSRWDVPDELHEPLEQQAVLLERGNGNPAAVSFLKFVKSPTARAIIERDGYRTQ